MNNDAQPQNEEQPPEGAKSHPGIMDLLAAVTQDEVVRLQQLMEQAVTDSNHDAVCRYVAALAEIKVRTTEAALRIQIGGQAALRTQQPSATEPNSATNIANKLKRGPAAVEGKKS